MSQNRGESEPVSGYVPLAGLLKTSKLRQDRPFSDGDVWAAFMSQNRNIAAHSCLKVYHKDPAQAFSHGPRPANGDARVSVSNVPFALHPVCILVKECPPAPLNL